MQGDAPRGQLAGAGVARGVDRQRRVTSQARGTLGGIPQPLEPPVAVGPETGTPQGRVMGQQGISCPSGQWHRSGLAVLGGPERHPPLHQIDVFAPQPFGFTPAGGGFEEEHQQIGRGGFTHLPEGVAQHVPLLVADYPIAVAAGAQLLRHLRHVLQVPVQLGIGEHGPQR